LGELFFRILRGRDDGGFFGEKPIILDGIIKNSRIHTFSTPFKDSLRILNGQEEDTEIWFWLA
jgi:hypothetical protein